MSDVDGGKMSPLQKTRITSRKEWSFHTPNPYSPVVEVDGQTYEAVELTAMVLAQCDCALILTGHSAFDYELIVGRSQLVFDTRNATRDVNSEKGNVVLL